MESLWSRELGNNGGDIPTLLSNNFPFYQVMLNSILLRNGFVVGREMEFLEMVLLLKRNGVPRNGFVVEEKWTKISSLLGVSLEERRQKTMASCIKTTYHLALEESLQWWITNSTGKTLFQLLKTVEIRV